MFVLQFVFAKIHRSGRVVKNKEGLETHHVTWTRGGRKVGILVRLYTSMCAINLRVSFLLVKQSISDLVNVWGLA